MIGKRAARHHCPRRYEVGAGRPDSTPDTYDRRSGLVNSFAPGCSYCGSISGEEFLQYVREGGVVGGSDKNYKVYLQRDTGVPWQQTTEKRPYGEVVMPVPGTGIQHAKFYFQHLTPGQCQEFIDLWNEGKVHHTLYVRPYFMRAAGDQ